MEKPKENEYASTYQKYIDLVESGDLKSKWLSILIDSATRAA